MTWITVRRAASGLALLTSIAAAEKREVSATVEWSANGGGTGSCLFQGTAEDTTLAGHLYIEADHFLVTGSIGSDGSVSGILKAASGEQVGTFSASLDAEQQLLGGFAVINGGSGEWAAPAEKLPLPD